MVTMSIQSIAKRGRLVAIVSQLALIAFSLVCFSLSFAGWQLLPNLVLIGIIMAKARIPAWFSLAAAGVAALFQLPFVTYEFGLKPIWMFFWGLTLLGLFLDIIRKPDDSKPISEDGWNTIVFKRWGMRALLLAFVLMTCSLFAGSGWRDGVAPDSDFASRRAWGERIFGAYLDHIDNWVAQSELINRDVGSIQGIAPTGSPNRYYPGFTDGQFAKMNLEVIGSKGKGELFLPYVEIWSTGELQTVGGDEARWRFGGEAHLIAKSGKSYLAEHGLEERYKELLKLAEDGRADEFVDRWYDFGTALASTNLKRRPTLRTGESGLMSALHDHYREPIIVDFADALAELDENNEAADAYRQAAEMTLARADDLLQEEDSRRELSQVAQALRRANQLIRLANELVPDDPLTLRLARTRVTMQHLCSIGGRQEPVYSENGKHDQLWADKCLGMFFEEAEAYARRSPYLKQTLGGIRSIRIAQNATSELEVDKHDVYEAAVFLDIVGRNGKKGDLLVTLRENYRRRTAIDLFSNNPRRPDYPLILRSASWTPAGGDWVKLSAKTGERWVKSKKHE